MNLNLLLLLLCTFGMPSFSQDKIEGIGRFKVGKATLSLIQQIVAETGIPLERVDAIVSIEKSSRSQLVEIKPNPKLSNPLLPSAPLCAQVRVFYLNNYQEEGVELQSAYLYFENDVLVKFTCRATSNLHKALELTYGQPEVNIVKLYSDCNFDAKSFILTWPNGSIVATMSVLVSYDSNCQKRVSQAFSIALEEKERQLERCEGIARMMNK